jgi:hypothetical protein
MSSFSNTDLSCGPVIYDLHPLLVDGRVGRTERRCRRRRSSRSPPRGRRGRRSSRGPPRGCSRKRVPSSYSSAAVALRVRV